MEKNDAINKIKSLPIIIKTENAWVDKKYKPFTLELVELMKVLKILTGKVTNIKSGNRYNKDMEKVIAELTTLFDEAKQRSEFEFIQTLINYKGMGSKELSTNIHEWFDAIEFYKRLYESLEDKEKTRIGLLLYSTFFENSDFYNIIGSLCKIKLGFKGSSYLFWKTKKYERLFGIGEKQDFLLELLYDADKPNFIAFFEENHFKEIRNSFFHSAYSLSDEEYIMHDSEPVYINGVGHSSFETKTFLYPKIEIVIQFIEVFRKLYFDSFASYREDKVVDGFFPNPVKVTILGSKGGLKGFRIKNSVNLYGQWHDSGIWYDEKYNMWEGHNIRFDMASKETIEIDEQLTRYEKKADINKHDAEFHNMIENIVERKRAKEIARATTLLVKFGDLRYKKMIDEKNPFKKDSYPNYILPFYKRAIDIGSQLIDTKEIIKRIKLLEKTNT